MKNVVLIIGARPNFMKAFPVYEALKNDFKLTLIHTGQHFDEKMSKVFFEQLKFPYPDIHLSLEKKTKAGDFDDKLYQNNLEYLKNKDQVIEDLINYKGQLGQLGEIRDKLKIEFEKISPDLVIVFGDVTSTLAAGLASKILNIDIAHVESGLRSGDIRMPEEVNRILTDHITKYYFVTEQSGIDNLKEIGITENVYLVGNTMIDTQKKYLEQALDTKYHEILNQKSKEYVLITLHRPSNVDDLTKLKEIFDDLEELSKTNKLVYPIHLRTKKNLKKIGYLEKVENNKNIILQDPLGYLEFTCLMANCKYVVTDSGGLQEESTALDIPCFTLRENTERPSTLIENNGTNQMIHKISEIELKECKGSMDSWDGKSSDRIYNTLVTDIDNKQIDYKFLFILSHPRSGSSYLTHIIRTNTDIFVFKEFFSEFKKSKINIQKQIDYFNNSRNTNIEMYEEKTKLNDYLNKIKKDLIKSGSTIGFTVFYNQLSIEQIKSISNRNDIKFITSERKNKINFGLSFYFSKKTKIFNSKQKSEFDFSKFYFEFEEIKNDIDNYYNFVNEFKKYSVFHFIYDDKYECNLLNEMLSKISSNYKKIETSIYDKNKTNLYSLSPNYNDIYNKLKLIYEC